MIADVALDHVAVAAARHQPLLPRYVEELGGVHVGYGEAVGFAPLQLRYANAAKIELLRPNMIHENDFLARFLEQNGPGAHHLTFKVPDIELALAECDAAGYPVIGVDLSWDHWKEAFIHPKAAHGIVIQLAQAAGDMPGAPPSWFPEPGATPAELRRVVHAVASRDDALGLFRDLLGGHELGTGDDDGEWTELGWKEPGLHVRLWQPRDPSVLRAKPGRVMRLEFTLGERRDTIAAADNFGTELRFVER